MHSYAINPCLEHWKNSLSNQIVDIVLTDTHKTLLTGDVFIGVGPAIKNKHEDGTESIADFDFYFFADDYEDYFNEIQHSSAVKFAVCKFDGRNPVVRKFLKTQVLLMDSSLADEMEISVIDATKDWNYDKDIVHNRPLYINPAFLAIQFAVFAGATKINVHNAMISEQDWNKFENLISCNNSNDSEDPVDINIEGSTIFIPRTGKYVKPEQMYDMFDSSNKPIPINGSSKAVIVDDDTGVKDKALQEQQSIDLEENKD